MVRRVHALTSLMANPRPIAKNPFFDGAGTDSTGLVRSALRRCHRSQHPRPLEAWLQSLKQGYDQTMLMIEPWVVTAGAFLRTYD